MKTEFIRKLSLTSAVVGLAASASGFDTFLIQGTVSFGATLGPVLTNTFGIATGDSFTGTLTYDSSATPKYVYGPGSSVVGYQISGALVSITVQGQRFGFYPPEIYVFHELGTPDWEIANAVTIQSDGEGWGGLSPWGSFSRGYGSFTLQNTPGFALPDYSLPTQLNIADWSTKHELDLATLFSTTGPDGRTIDGGSFGLTAIITSITVAPEPGTMAILGLGFVGLALFRRRQRG
jgi:hypothetical protein